MNCEEARQQLLRAVDGELPAAQAGLLAQHLSQCAACAVFDAQLRGTAERLRGVLGDFAPPSDLAANCLAALQAEAARNVQRGAARPPLGWRAFRAAALAAASLALALTGLGVISPPAYAMVVSGAARLGAEATAIAVQRVPAWSYIMQAADSLLALFGR